MDKTNTLIFGATGGMGRAIAKALVAESNSVHLAARNAQKLAALANELSASYSPCDVLDDSQVSQAVEDAGSSLSGLVFAVGSIDLKPLKACSADNFHQALALNTVSAAMAIKAALPALKANQGSVLLFSTVAVGQGFANHALVASAKGAIEGLTRSLAAEFAPKIRVNAIAPSLTDTAMASALLGNDAMRASLGKAHPLGRIGEPRDIAGLAALLLSPQSSWITGQVIGVDGGRAAVAGRG